MTIKEARRKPYPVGPLSKGWAKDFWAKVDKSGGDDACWPWLGKNHSIGGIPRVRYMGRRDYYTCRRVVQFLTTGKEPGWVHIWLGCGNKNCLNPKHFLLGRADQATRDKQQWRATNRAVRGNRHYKAILTIEDVPVIRRLLKEGLPMTKIGKRFGVSSSAINQLKRGSTWKHVPEESAEAKPVDHP